MVISLQGRPVPLNALGCETGTCDKDLHEELGKLIDKRRKERFKDERS